MCAKARAAPTACKGAAVAATSLAARSANAVRRAWRSIASWWRGPSHLSSAQLAGNVVGLVGGVLATGTAGAVSLPEDRADALLHLYDGGGVTASGPALLIRKSMADRVSLSASYYVDMVSNASIDVVTTASPFNERRNEIGLGLDYAYRDSLLTLSTTRSKEPDYVADSVSMDVSQEVFGGMTTVNLGFTRGSDDVGKVGEGFFDTATHWRYRLGVTQILTPRWLMSANLEAVSDDGYLGSPYRSALVFGAAVPERNPRTRSSRAIKFGAIGEILPRTAVRGEYRYFWDNWDIKAHTFEAGLSRYVGESFLIDGYLRHYSQSHALFYSDNATTETIYVSRNRQLSTFNSLGLGAKVSYVYAQVPGKYEIKANLGYELAQFKFKDFTDVRTGKLYEYNANILQLFLTATF
jgi:Protein of unknown function (DUF3570)